MRMQLAMAELLKAPQDPEQVARQQKKWADLRAEEARQQEEQLSHALGQLNPESRRIFEGISPKLRDTHDHRMLFASILLQTEGFALEPRSKVLVAAVSSDSSEVANALLSLGRRFNTGQQKDEPRWARAKQAWLNAHRRGRAHRAVKDAMEASGFGQSAVYARAKRGNWKAELEKR
ncbi:hypothetical protein [Archangium primigenium]|uniref:hypothetical protein n=1 Tax=[Archangium] primigenium TaxID=2792470 RepID=UPI00195B9B84|nr:hypothetical protein [Archangium primigenium]MBM7117657.1 hypothetical protein [Archangium primigenium]